MNSFNNLIIYAIGYGAAQDALVNSTTSQVQKETYQKPDYTNDKSDHILAIFVLGTVLIICCIIGKLVSNHITK